MRKHMMISNRGISSVLLAIAVSGVGLGWAQAGEAPRPIKVFVLAGDENVLEQAPISGHTDGVHEDFYPNASAVDGEQKKHANCAVYKGGYDAKADYDALAPVATGIVELGDQRTRQKEKGKRGREAVPFTPFPELSAKDGYTTVIRGFVTVPYAGSYEFHPGSGESAFNVTTLEGKEVYKREPGQDSAVIRAVELERGKRYAFRTLFFGKPGHDFRIPLLNKPGCLETVVDTNPEYAFLRDASGAWRTRDDVALYDLHPIHNNTRTPGHFLQVGDAVYGGEAPVGAIGPELMLGHVLGNAINDPVLMVRFATHGGIGSRSLGHDYLSPAAGGSGGMEGSWDVIHFNWGVWDVQHRDASFKFYEGDGKHPTSYEDWEANLRTLVARMKATGATLIWASVTPVWAGDPGTPNADVKRYNAIAEKVMQENGVIIDDLYSESIRQGFPKSTNVHSVGSLQSKVRETVLEALANRKNPSQPLPRVLFIGDSITGTYIKGLMSDLDGKAFVCMHSGNAESTWNGLRKIDEWLDLNCYARSGQEYRELVDGLHGVFEKPQNAYPGYAGQKLELSGLVWFQGIKDTFSPAMAADYEQNLASLIRDLRKEFKAPGLPVVVTTLGYDDSRDKETRGQVVKAQMAVSDPGAHPEFAGNVVSVDTSPLFRPGEVSPGGRPQYYFSNAETFLEIGEAMGKAMLHRAD